MVIGRTIVADRGLDRDEIRGAVSRYNSWRSSFRYPQPDTVVEIREPIFNKVIRRIVLREERGSIFEEFEPILRKEIRERNRIFKEGGDYIDINVFTINNPKEMKTLLELLLNKGGIQGIITDDIPTLRKTFNELYKPSGG